MSSILLILNWLTPKPKVLKRVQFPFLFPFLFPFSFPLKWNYLLYPYLGLSNSPFLLFHSTPPSFISNSKFAFPIPFSSSPILPKINVSSSTNSFLAQNQMEQQNPNNLNSTYFPHILVSEMRNKDD